MVLINNRLKIYWLLQGLEIIVPKILLAWPMKILRLWYPTSTKIWAFLAVCSAASRITKSKISGVPVRKETVANVRGSSIGCL